jgi:hypothetical protein
MEIKLVDSSNAVGESNFHMQLTLHSGRIFFEMSKLQN